MIESWNRVALHAEMEHAVVEGMQLVERNNSIVSFLENELPTLTGLSNSIWTESGEVGVLPD
jgi:hypothetical protein